MDLFNYPLQAAAVSAALHPEHLLGSVHEVRDDAQDLHEGKHYNAMVRAHGALLQRTKRLRACGHEQDYARHQVQEGVLKESNECAKHGCLLQTRDPDRFYSARPFVALVRGRPGVAAGGLSRGRA